MERRISARWIVEGEEVREGAVLVIREGRIAGIEERGVGDEGEVEDLGEVALIPGQINVHSHSFQRGLRGRTEYVEAGREEEDFWTWREGMYGLALGLSAEAVEAMARLAFWEMLRAGITHVGEFHYLHHGRDGEPYGDRLELAKRIEKAAGDVGIRLTLLPVAYHTAGIGEAHREEQRRFVQGSVEEYLSDVRALREAMRGKKLVRVGMAPHSIRAVPREWMEAIAAEAGATGEVVHIHACEQRREVAESVEAFGVPPMEALHRWGVLEEGWTVIHGTHLSERELSILEDVRPTVGACPTTERNLGDGFLPVVELMERGVPIALGSDSHTVIDPFCEMRLVEYHERLRREERNVLAHFGESKTTAGALWPMGTVWGARSLGSDDGALRVGGPADFVAVDLRHPTLVGTSRQTLLTDIVLSMSCGAVQTVYVAGEARIEGGRHGLEEEIVEESRRVLNEVW